MPIKNHKKFFFTALLLLLFLRLPAFFNDFMDSDEGIYGAVGLAIHHGDLPYRDAIERKTPLIYYTYAAIFAVFGDGNMLAVHLTIALWIGLGAFLLLLVGKELVADKTELASAPYWIMLSYVVTTTFFNFELLAANCEMFLDLPLIFAFLMLLRQQRCNKIGYAVLAGVGFGTAFLYKQTALMPFSSAAFGLFLWAFGFFEDSLLPKKLTVHWHRLWMLFVMIGTAIALVWGSYGYFYLQGIHQDYFFWAWQVNFKYIHDSFDRSYVIKKFIYSAGFFAITMSPLLIAVGGCLKNRQFLLSHAWLPIFWLLGQFAGLWISGKFYSHYYFHLIAPLCLLGGVGLVQLRPVLQRRCVAATAGLSLIFCLVWFCKEKLLVAYGYGAPDFRSIAQQIEQHSTPNDRIFVWGYSPEIYVLSKRLSASRFIFCDYLTGRISGHPKVKDPNFDTAIFATPGAWDMLQEDLSSKRPLYIVDTAAGGFHQYSKYPLEKYPWLRDYVAANYQLETMISGAKIYRRLFTKAGT